MKPQFFLDKTGNKYSMESMFSKTSSAWNILTEIISSDNFYYSLWDICYLQNPGWYAFPDMIVPYSNQKRCRYNVLSDAFDNFLHKYVELKKKHSHDDASRFLADSAEYANFVFVAVNLCFPEFVENIKKCLQLWHPFIVKEPDKKYFISLYDIVTEKNLEWGKTNKEVQISNNKMPLDFPKSNDDYFIPEWDESYKYQYSRGDFCITFTISNSYADFNLNECIGKRLTFNISQYENKDKNRYQCISDEFYSKDFKSGRELGKYINLYRYFKSQHNQNKFIKMLKMNDFEHNKDI